MFKKFPLTKAKFTIILIVLIALTNIIAVFLISSKLESAYFENESKTILDRNHQVIAILPNKQDYYAEYAKDIPDNFKKMLLVKEDKFFYYHPGVNFLSFARSIYDKLVLNKTTASSTITNQLVKILLNHENNRSLKNKLIEIYYSLALETTRNKNDILTMYINSIFLGNNVQGVKSASLLYFEKSAADLTREEILKLLITINNPTNTNPFTIKNRDKSQKLATSFGLNPDNIIHIPSRQIENLQQKFSTHNKTGTFFELQTFNFPKKNIQTTIDQKLTKNIREITYSATRELIQKNAINASVIVIKIPENEVLAMIGSPNPTINDAGYQINMALKPRQIGSTIKPFIYLKGFENGLRPYSLVNDREYKYTIGSGYALYPKNYNYKYNGIINLHYALSNSLNVPTVKVLEYIGLEKFYNFLTRDMDFKPVQELGQYQLGIALGEMDMSLIELAHFFTIFPNDGILNPLKITSDKENILTQKFRSLNHEKIISEKKYIELINAILSDRARGVDQFSAQSNLNLPYSGYAVKTGTSENFRDSWAIGYTKDYLVGVWVGNHNWEKMEYVSGTTGAGQIWRDVMNLMHNSEYNKKTPFDFNEITQTNIDGNSELSLPNDNPQKLKNLLIENKLILKPHDQDEFLFEENMQIPLTASKEVIWEINGINHGNINYFSPDKTGEYNIKAVGEDDEENLKVFINAE